MHRQLFIASYVVSSVLRFSLSLPSSFPLVFAIMVVTEITSAPMVVLMDASVMVASQVRLDLSKMRLRSDQLLWLKRPQICGAASSRWVPLCTWQQPGMLTAGMNRTRLLQLSDWQVKWDVHRFKAGSTAKYACGVPSAGGASAPLGASWWTGLESGLRSRPTLRCAYWGCCPHCSALCRQVGCHVTSMIELWAGCKPHDFLSTCTGAGTSLQQLCRLSCRARNLSSICMAVDDMPFRSLIVA